MTTISEIEESVAYNASADSVELNVELTKSKDLTKDDLLMASTLVNDAKDGRLSNFILNPKAIKLYLIYHHWGYRYLLYFIIFVHHAVAICEEPSVIGYKLPVFVTQMIEHACMTFYIFRLSMAAAYISGKLFISDKKHLAVCVSILLTIIDMAVYNYMMEAGHSSKAYRWSRLLRPIFLINLSENKQVRRAFRNIRKTLPDIANVLVLFFLGIAVFALMGLKLFQNRGLMYPNGKPYFVDYFDIYFELYVLVTTANNPDIMMPAYDSNRWFALYFIAYLIICLYMFMNIFLAVIYNNYRKHLKNEVRKLIYRKRQSLAKAFKILQIKRNEKFVLDFDRFSVLLETIPPTRSSMLSRIFWYVLDGNSDNEIELKDFFHLADLLNITVSEVHDRRSIFDQLVPKIYRSIASKTLRKCVAHRFFRYFFDLLILINAILIAADINMVEWVFLAFFATEIVLKIYSFGLLHFLKRFWNVFDLIIIGGAVVGTAIESIDNQNTLEQTRTLDILLVLRVLRLVKIIGSIQRFQVIVTTILNLGPSILTYGGVLFVMFYMYAIVGMAVFNNKINFFGYDNGTKIEKLFCGNQKLNGSYFYESHYCSNNFNNILQSFVLLFELMVVNQWHVLANGFVLVTSKVTRLYFFAFHLTTVIIVLNIFTAFVLEAFILEYSVCKSKLESSLERSIIDMGLQLGRKATKAAFSKDDDDNLVDSEDLPENIPPVTTDLKQNHKDFSNQTDIRFILSKNKNVENLLLRMFENELEVDDIGPEDIDNLDESN